jgi:methionine synthase II (cobalamin-independent)
MKWESFDDYMKKYDETVNADNAAIRHEIWDACEVARALYIEKNDPLWRSNAPEFFSPEEYDRTFKLGAP